MFQNLEFIKNRSFEISWAVFRCAALVKHKHLREELESSAVALTSKYGTSVVFVKTNNNAYDLGFVSEIEKLVSLIKLAEAIGEIKIINARVLYRELNNLEEAIKKAEKTVFRVSAPKAEEEVFIEGIFSKYPAIVDDSNNANFGFGEQKKSVDLAKKIQSPGNHESKINVGQQPKSAVSNSALAVAEFKNKGNSAIISSQIRQINNLAITTEKQTKMMPSSVAMTEEESIQDSWQNLIYRKMKEIGKASTKEIAAFFPKISERTVRFYLQKLTDSAMIERIGTSGPGSYYIFKK